MALTPAQAATLKAAINADPTLAAMTSGPGTDFNAIAVAMNAASNPAFIVRKSSVQTDQVGKVVSYAAIGAMTSANTARISLFYDMNPTAFFPSADIEAFFADTFSGALAGAGQATRDALVALWRRTATRCERLFATGTGDNANPGTLVWEGSVSLNDVAALYL